MARNPRTTRSSSRKKGKTAPRSKASSSDSHDLISLMEEGEEPSKTGNGKRPMNLIIRTIDGVAPLLIKEEPRKRGRWPKKLVEELEAILAEYPLPHTRAECRYGVRPCPYTTCKHHLISKDPREENQKVRLNFPSLESMPTTCELDVTEGLAFWHTKDGIRDFAEIAHFLGITRERARQIFESAKEKLRKQILEEGISPEDVAHLFSGRGSSFTLSELVSQSSSGAKLRRKSPKLTTDSWPTELDDSTLAVVDSLVLSDLPPIPGEEELLVANAGL